jgi:multiple sugar transport system ATP-binding protein
MPSISMRRLRKTYPGHDVNAVHDIDLEIEDKEFIVLVGPSGCGKSTTLRMLAGLEDITAGELYIGDALVNDIAPKDRDIAMVFQNYALYPHMTVYKNMAFSLELRNGPRDEVARRVEETAKTLHIEHLLNRKPKALSGGQRQRVALGRAMVRDPAVFLLDEPLSNLDAKLRATMRLEITKLHKRLGTTFVYVTHDQVEAMTMGDRIVVMKDGRIQQTDTPQTLYDRPCNLFVASFIGSPQMNMLPVSLDTRNGDPVALFGDIVLPLPREITAAKSLPPGGRPYMLGIRPEHICDDQSPLMQAATTVLMRAVVALTEPLGPETQLSLTIGSDRLIARMPPRCRANRAEEISIGIDCTRLHLFDAETGLAIRCGPVLSAI